MISYRYYFLGSLAAVSYSVYHAYSIQKYFYPTVLSLTTSNLSKALILNFAFSLVIGVFLGFIKIFFGKIEQSEKTAIVDKLKRKIIDFALLLIVIPEEIFDHAFIIMFLFLMILTVLHWLAIRRSEYIIAELHKKYFTLVKIELFMIGLIVLDIQVAKRLFYFELNTHFKHLLILFSYEVILLLVKITLPTIKFTFYLYEVLSLSQHESKQMLFTILEFCFSVTKLVLNIMMNFYIGRNIGIPIFLIGDIFENVYNLMLAFNKFFKSIVLSHKLNKFY